MLRYSIYLKEWFLRFCYFCLFFILCFIVFYIFKIQILYLILYLNILIFKNIFYFIYTDILELFFIHIKNALFFSFFLSFYFFGYQIIKFFKPGFFKFEFLLIKIYSIIYSFCSLIGCYLNIFFKFKFFKIF